MSWGHAREVGGRRSVVRFPIRVKFAVVLVVLVPAIAATGVVSALGLASVHRQARQLYSDHVVTSTATARLAAGLARAQLLAVETGAAADPASRQRLRSQLVQTIPDTEASLLGFDELHADDASPTERAYVGAVDGAWREFLAALDGSSVAPGPRAAAGLDPAIAATGALSRREQSDAQSAAAGADRAYAAGLRLLVLIAVLSTGVGVGVVAWLTRTVVPRVRSYSRFAGEVARGAADGDLAVRGRDELGDLGAALANLVGQARAQRRYEQTQAEVVDALQVAEDEAEAHELVRRHLQRSVPGSVVTVLNRNNSANRLQAMTELAPGSPLAATLVGATPRSCLALRFARVHVGGPTGEPEGRPGGESSLLDCAVCAVSRLHTRCEPLLVGGEVIGSVLVEHGRELDAAGALAVSDTVAQGAPVLANLRNLALAEFRANNDSLTGLPNKRATQDALLRMVAQASRAVSPLAVILLDLDHFKQVNDRHGHGAGDEVLAAVGATIGGSLRASDAAGRFGGEEFLVLLPETGVDGALLVAENIRVAVERIRIPGTDQTISVSLGVAVVPDHAGDAATLLRHADRALYAAKARGRNCTVVAEQAVTGSLPPGAAAARATP